MTSGYAPPAAPDPNAEVVRLLRAVLTALQVLCAVVAIFLLVFVAWLLGLVPEALFSPVVQIRV